MLWESCNQLRGGMDASQYKNYVLVLLFVKYMSDKQKAGKDMLFQIPEGCTFDDMWAIRKDTHVGEKIDIMLSQWAEEFMLTGVLDKASFQDESNLGKGKDLVKTVGKLLNVFQYSGLNLADNRAEDDEISLLESERAKYEQIRSGMMEELLTGKKRLIKKIKWTKTLQVPQS